MDTDIDLLPSVRLTSAGPVTAHFLSLGIRDFRDAARHVWRLPYGRISDRSKVLLVLTEGRGTCTTKHALLAELAAEHGVDVGLTLGIYEMGGGRSLDDMWRIREQCIAALGETG